MEKSKVNAFVLDGIRQELAKNHLGIFTEKEDNVSHIFVLDSPIISPYCLDAVQRHSKIGIETINVDGDVKLALFVLKER